MQWKRIWPLSLLICLMWTGLVLAKVESDDCVGFWLTEGADATIEVFKRNEKYHGKLVWLKDLHTGKKKEILDVNNKDKSRHDKPLLGMVNMKSFSFDPKEQEWKGGTIYDPKNGKEYSAYMKLKDGKMHLRGFVGIPLFGRTSIWTREEKAIPKSYRK